MAALTIGSPLTRAGEARAQSQPNHPGKVSPDLRRKLGQAGRVDVIVQFDPSDRSLDYAVSALGGRVTRSYRNLNVRAVNLPASAVEALAKRPNVKFISPDRRTACSSPTCARRPAGRSSMAIRRRRCRRCPTRRSTLRPPRPPT